MWKKLNVELKNFGAGKILEIIFYLIFKIPEHFFDLRKIFWEDK